MGETIVDIELAEKKGLKGVYINCEPPFFLSIPKH